MMVACSSAERCPVMVVQMLGGGYGQVASNVNISNPTYQVFDPVAKGFAGPQQYLQQLNETWPINL